ncbi:N-acetylmuramoyl-L-alanine amidase [Calothrix sp. CCY 0018]|uniref:N-acetylmuramoyl-L-alanine amidase n=1 Tax=Calothrix sp. CCY 0018 TaxID=3103864 RepID=UPI0039C6FDED
MKIAFDLGHGCKPDGGAVGIRSEEDLINEVGQIVIADLKELGHQVILCRPAKVTSVMNSLWQRCNTANQNAADIFVSLHFNAFNGKAHGTETYALSANGRKIGIPVQREICKLGFADRGVKSGRFYVLKNTAMPAILIEGCFCDSSRDIKLFNAQAMANAITVGLVGKLPVKDDCPCH